MSQFGPATARAALSTPHSRAFRITGGFAGQEGVRLVWTPGSISAHAGDGEIAIRESQTLRDFPVAVAWAARTGVDELLARSSAEMVLDRDALAARVVRYANATAIAGAAQMRRYACEDTAPIEFHGDQSLLDDGVVDHCLPDAYAGWYRIWRAVGPIGPKQGPEAILRPWGRRLLRSALFEVFDECDELEAATFAAEIIEEPVMASQGYSLSARRLITALKESCGLLVGSGMVPQP